MILFIQELVLLLFLWMLRMIDGMIEIFSVIAGVTDVSYQGGKINLIGYIVGDSTVGTIFWCVFILAVGLTCIFAIVGIIKNMLANNRNLSSIGGKFFLALLGTLAMLAVVILGILIANSLLVLVSKIFQVQNTTKLSNAIFNACAGQWLNGYSIAELDITNFSVGEIFGDYNSAAFGIWPTSWKMNGMINPDKFYYLPALIASIAVLIALVVAIINLAKRVYEIVILYIVMPVSMSTLPLDDGARFKIWRETFLTKIVLAYGAVVAVNVFILVLPFVTSVHLDGVNSFGNALFEMFMIIGGAMMIPAGQTLFARLFGVADDMHAGGSFLHTAFYGGRAVGAMTFGTAFHLLGGAFKGIGKAIGSRKKKDSKDGNNSEDEHYSEEGGSDEGGETT